MASREKVVLAKYNFLKPIKKESYNEKKRNWNWLFLCDCGKYIIANIYSVRANKTKSCGCLKAKNLNSGIGVNSNTWKGKTPISTTYISSIKRRAISKNYVYDVSDEYLWEIYIKQKERCNISGVKISISNSNFTASIDRIDSSIGYVENNIQWVHKDINYLKYTLSTLDLFEICKKIKEKHIDVYNRI